MEPFLNGKIQLHIGDCLDVLPTLPDNSIDSCVTDPPYGLQFMGREWDKLWRNDTEADRNYVDRTKGELTSRARKLPDYSAAKPAQMQAWHEQWARQVYRVLKPGAHLVAFGGTRTYHRMACAIEDAGFEIRDCIQWLYGSGFPKSHDVSKGIDRAAGAERESIGKARDFARDGAKCDAARHKQIHNVAIIDDSGGGWNRDVTIPATDAARQWEGWGTALKPACEPIVLARKPLSERTVAANVLRWGTGAINVNDCRVGTSKDVPASPSTKSSLMSGLDGGDGSTGGCDTGSGFDPNIGRWPANVIHDGSDEVLAGFPESESIASERGNLADIRGNNFHRASGNIPDSNSIRGHNDSGSAARFFYTAQPNQIEQVVITWISESEPCQAMLLVDTEQLLGKAIVASASKGDNGWSTFLSGNTLTDLFQKASNCTIRTEINSTTQSKTWNWLTTLLTKEFTADVKYETANGGNRAENVGNGIQSLIITLGKTVSLPGANSAASGTRLKISVSVADAEQLNNAKRFHYTSKAGADDRLGSFHPTVKPLDLMQYLVRLVTPKGGTVLDPFAGTGTTGEAAFREGMRAVLIEREAEYQADVRRRADLCMAGPDQRQYESAKAKMAGKPRDDGPLFGGTWDDMWSKPFNRPDLV